MHKFLFNLEYLRVCAKIFRGMTVDYYPVLLSSYS